MVPKKNYGGWVVLAIILLVLPFALGVCVWFGNRTDAPTRSYAATDELSQRIATMQDPDPVIALDDIVFPEGMRDGALGLYWTTPKGEKQVNYIKSTSPEAENAFDPSKPTMIYFHGMALMDGRWFDEDFYLGRYWLDKGYNTAIFYWSQYADLLMPWVIEPQIWGKYSIDPNTGAKKNIVAWTDENNELHNTDEDTPNVSVTEIFVAYYLDFMMSREYNAPEIRFTGLSMGGQMVTAAASYLVTKEIQGLLPTSLIPDRVTMYDPYILGWDSELTRDFVYCPWLRYTITQKKDADGNVVLDSATGKPVYTTVGDMIGEVLQMMHNRGVALEYIPTVSGGVPNFLGDGTAHDLFYASTAVLEFDIELDVNREYAEFFLENNFNMNHLAGREWYSMTWAVNPDAQVFKDSAMQNTSDYSLSPWTPSVYTYLRAGVTYEHHSFGTLTPADDIISSKNVTSAQVGGFAFEDLNANGKYDDRIRSRLAGVKVELYLVNGAENRLLASTITDHTGAYLFDVAPQYANGFDQLFVKVYGPAGYQMTNAATGDWTEVSTFGANGESARFTLAHQKTLKVVNAGFVKA